MDTYFSYALDMIAWILSRSDRTANLTFRLRQGVSVKEIRLSIREIYAQKILKENLNKASCYQYTGRVRTI